MSKENQSILFTKTKVEPFNRDINFTGNNAIKEKENQRPKGYIKDIIIEATFDTTTHGIDHIFKRHHPFIRFVWTVCFLASIGVCAYMITISIMNFFEYETVTKSEQVYLVSTDFPAVTICNVNPFMTNVSVDFFKSIIKQTSVVTGINYDQFFDKMSAADLALFWYLSGTNALNPNLTDTFRKSLGYQIDDILYSCMYNLIKCTADDFVWFYDIMYGNCFTFNSGRYQNGSAAPIRQSYKVGAINGLYMELVHFDQTGASTLSCSNGIRMVVHNQSKTPSFYEGSLISAGAQTQVDVQREFSYHLEKPYSDCTKDITIDYPSDIVKSILNAGYPYNQKDCFNACFQKYLVNKCGCYDFMLPASITKLMMNGSDVRPCQSFGDIMCDTGAYATFFSLDVGTICGAECPLECEFVKYNLYISQADYPSLLYADALMKNSAIQSKFGMNEVNLKYEFLKRNMLQASVYYSDMGYQKYEELEKTNVVDLVSSIGGTLGLFLGMSFLSFVEILDVFLQICFYRKPPASDRNSSF